MKRWNAALFLLALTLILTASMRGAMAYFTTYIIADGGYEIRLGSDVEISEEISNWTKHILLTNKEDSEPVYVRVNAFCGSQYELTYAAPDGGWIDGGDGYYYYDTILYGGESAAELDIHISNVPEDAKDGDGFHVIVIYETTPVQYREDGTPYADWSLATQEGGSNP